MLSETEKAYLAGLIDGEGSISLIQTQNRPGPQLKISIGNTNPVMIDWIHSNVGRGFIHFRELSKKNPKHKDSYVWTVSHGDAEWVLKEVYPYLVIKKPQAKIVLGLIEDTNRAKEESNCKKFGYNKACPEWLTEKRYGAVCELHTLNRKSPENTNKGELN